MIIWYRFALEKSHILNPSYLILSRNNMLQVLIGSTLSMSTTKKKTFQQATKKY